MQLRPCAASSSLFPIPDAINSWRESTKQREHRTTRRAKRLDTCICTSCDKARYNTASEPGELQAASIAWCWEVPESSEACATAPTKTGAPRVKGHIVVKATALKNKKNKQQQYSSAFFRTKLDYTLISYTQKEDPSSKLHRALPPQGNPCIHGYRNNLSRATGETASV